MIAAGAPMLGLDFHNAVFGLELAHLARPKPHYATASRSTFACIILLILTYPIPCRYQITQWATSGALRPLIASKLQSASPRLGTAMEYFKAKPSTEQVRSKVEESSNKVFPTPIHSAPELIGVKDGLGTQGPRADIEDIEESKKGWFAYFRTRNFYIVLVLGYAI